MKNKQIILEIFILFFTFLLFVSAENIPFCVLIFFILVALIFVYKKRFGWGNKNERL